MSRSFPARRALRVVALTALATTAPPVAHAASPSAAKVQVGHLGGGARALLARNPDRSWGLRVVGAGAASVSQPRPAALELDPAGRPASSAPGARLQRVSRGYTRISREGATTLGRATVPAAPGVRVAFVDRWRVERGSLVLRRRVTVHGSAGGGFLSALTVVDPRPLPRRAYGVFAPATTYGTPDGLPPDGRPGVLAIGSAPTFGPGFGGVVRIREDRLPAPLYGTRFTDGSSVALLHGDPTGATVAADGTERGTLVDARLRFGALGSQPAGDGLEFGFWYPGTEGEVSYELQEADADDRHRWLRREHPLRDGLTQAYEVRLRVGRGESPRAFQRASWRWAVRRLRPEVRRVDPGVVRSSVAAMLAGRIVTTPQGTGIPNDADATTGRELFGSFRPALMGFIGKDVENAALLMQDAVQHPGPGAARRRALGRRLIDSFAARLPMAPPAAAGFDLTTGAPTSFYPQADRVYLRQLTDEFKALAHLLRFERARGREHPEWLAWMRSFADWLLPRQTAVGGFPRAWQNGTGVVVDASTSTSDLTVPWLLDLAALTGDARYRRAAIRAGELGARRHAGGRYAGSTIDQGDVVAKEPAALALEASLALHRATGQARWLTQARRDAEALETWIWQWDVPMPTGADPATLGWKPGVPTTGMNLVAAGVTGSDAYLGGNVPELLELARRTRDPHWRDVARLLLHGSQAMLALPGRTYDLAGPGWQQEFFTFSAPRGSGTILGGVRDWVPWVSAVKLRGILLAEQADPAAFARIAQR